MFCLILSIISGMKIVDKVLFLFTLEGVPQKEDSSIYRLTFAS